MTAAGPAPRETSTLRIVQLTSSLLSPLGGAEQYALMLARHQRADGHDVTVVTGSVSPDIRRELAAEGLPLVVLPRWRPYPPDRRGPTLAARVLFHAVELADSVRRTGVTRAIERLAPDVVHVHRYAGLGTAPLRVRGARVAHTVHDYTLVDTSASLVRDGVVLRRASRVQRVRAALALSRTRGIAFVFPSARTLERHVELGFDATRHTTHVVPHGWPAPPTPPTVRDPDAPFSFLFMGKLEPHKGVDVLLEEWGDGIDGAVLRVAGDGSRTDRVRASTSVDALGWLDDDGRGRALADADALVMPSLWPENFPIVVAESMLAAVPVITTDVASPPLVEDGDSGLVVGDQRGALRAAMARLAADPTLRTTLSRGAARQAEALDMDVHAAALENLYARRPARDDRPGRAATGS